MTRLGGSASWIGDSDPARNRWLKLALFAVWLGLVIVMEARHTFFRDEVRALSLALQGRDVGAMLAGIHGEGHPAVWYLLLRGGHALWASPAVLPVVSVCVAAAAALLCVLRGPFAWWMILLGLFSRFALFEYSVMARNYGISVLLMFTIAAVYTRRRNSGVLLGLLLALLANTNIHSVILAGAFLLAWFVDVVRDQGLRWSVPLRTFLINAAIAAAGVILCAATVYPTVNDAAVIQHPGGLKVLDLARAILLPAGPLDNLLGTDPLHMPPPLRGVIAQALVQFAASLALFGAALSLIRYPGAFLAALFSLLGLSVLSATLSHGAYRHDALWLSFVLSLHWVVRSGATAEYGWPAPVAAMIPSAARIGGALLVAVLALQVEAGLLWSKAAAQATTPAAVGGFGSFMAGRPDLHDAVIIADPDFLLEAMPYYVRNPTYLVRENRFGAVVHFTRRARLSLSLPDLLEAARRLRGQTGKPVMILLQTPLSPATGPAAVAEGYDWRLTFTRADAVAFLGATQRLGHFAPASEDGDFDAYLLK